MPMKDFRPHVCSYLAEALLDMPGDAPSKALDVELAFTQAHIAHVSDPPALREAYSLQALYPACFLPIQKGDLFAGWMLYPCVGFGMEDNSGGSVYYYFRDIIQEVLKRAPFTDQKRRCVGAMMEYWRHHATTDYTVNGNPMDYYKMPPECRFAQALTPAQRAKKAMPVGGHNVRLAGINLNFDKLLQKGLNGMIDEAEAYIGACDDTARPFYQGVVMVMEMMQNVCRFYAEQAADEASREGNAVRKGELLRIQESCERIAVDAPNSLHSAMQLMWLYQWSASVVNFSRMDEYLGDFLVNDLENGTLTMDGAQELINSLWRMIARKKIVMNHRVIIGGKGRRNESNADRFAMMAMEASRQVVETEPQLTLRFYRGQNPELMKKALDVIGEGIVYPMLFNDDAYIPTVMNAFHAAPEDAARYMPYGCGETTMQGMCVSSPNCIINMHKLVEGMIFDGFDTYGELAIPYAGHTFAEYESFEDFYADLVTVMDDMFGYNCERSVVEMRLEAEECSFLLASALTDDCMPRGRAILDGGVRYKGGVVESYGLVNAADSLAVIKKFVFDEKRFSAARLQDMLRRNWQGYEAEYKLISDLPKFGNDHAESDGMLCRLSDDMCSSCSKQAEIYGLDFYLVCNVNNRAHSTMGLMMPATPDGRREHSALANGTMPTAGNDVRGFTALARSVTGVNELNNAGYTHNLKFSKATFRNERPKVECLLETFFALGGTSAMITCVGREDMQNAKKEPEKYRNLMVRVGGFCARFVELDPNLQDDLINRTMY